MVPLSTLRVEPDSTFIPYALDLIVPEPVMVTDLPPFTTTALPEETVEVKVCVPKFRVTLLPKLIDSPVLMSELSAIVSPSAIPAFEIRVVRPVPDDSVPLPLLM